MAGDVARLEKMRRVGGSCGLTLTHPVHALTHALTHSLTHSLTLTTHSLTHSLKLLTLTTHSNYSL